MCVCVCVQVQVHLKSKRTLGARWVFCVCAHDSRAVSSRALSRRHRPKFVQRGNTGQMFGARTHAQRDARTSGAQHAADTRKHCKCNAQAAAECGDVMGTRARANLMRRISLVLFNPNVMHRWEEKMRCEGAAKDAKRKERNTHK